MIETLHTIGREDVKHSYRHQYELSWRIHFALAFFYAMLNREGWPQKSTRGPEITRVVGTRSFHQK